MATNTTSLSASVECARLRYLEEKENFFYNADRQEWRDLDVSNALNSWAPEMEAFQISHDHFVVTVVGDCDKDFTAAFHLEKEKAFTRCSQLTPRLLHIRCIPPEDRRADAERFVLEQVAIAFLPF